MDLIKKIKPFLLTLILLSSLAVAFISTSQATDQTVICDESGGCTGVTGPLFSHSSLYPTQIITQTITAINNYADTRDFAVAISSSNFSDSSPSMASMLSVLVTEQESGLVVYSAPDINHWKNDGYIILSSIPSSQTRHYDFIITFADVGNDYQGKNLFFDLNLGFDALPPHTSLATTNISCDNRNFDAIMTVKNDGSPASGVNVDFKYNNLTLIATTNSQGKAQVGFTQSGDQSVIATPQDNNYSQQSLHISAPTGCPDEGDGGGGEVAGITTSQSFFSPINTEESQGTIDKELNKSEIEPGQDGEILGASDCSSYFFWWIPLIIQLILTVAYYAFKKHKKPLKTVIWIPLLLSIISQAGHLIFGCSCTTSAWCKYYWIINIIILLLSTATYKITKKY